MSPLGEFGCSLCKLPFFFLFFNQSKLRRGRWSCWHATLTCNYCALWELVGSLEHFVLVFPLTFSKVEGYAAWKCESQFGMGEEKKRHFTFSFNSHRIALCCSLSFGCFQTLISDWKKRLCSEMWPESQAISCRKLGGCYMLKTISCDNTCSLQITAARMVCHQLVSFQHSCSPEWWMVDTTLLDILYFGRLNWSVKK